MKCPLDCTCVCTGSCVEIADEMRYCGSARTPLLVHPSWISCRWLAGGAKILTPAWLLANSCTAVMNQKLCHRIFFIFFIFFGLAWLGSAWPWFAFFYVSRIILAASCTGFIWTCFTFRAEKLLRSMSFTQLSPGERSVSTYCILWWTLGTFCSTFACIHRRLRC